MSRKNTWFRLCLVGLVVVGAEPDPSAVAQEKHLHTPRVSGMPEGVPLFCAQPTVASVATGEWSNPRTWSTNKVPAANDKVAIAAGHRVTYDLVSNDKIECVAVAGELTFATAATTRMKVVTLMVLEDGVLEIGSVANPVAPGATAEIVIADQPISPAIDPSQVGNGIIALGRVRMHGTAKAPTFTRVIREPLSSQTTLTLEQPVTGWKTGDHLVIPDTRQLPDEPQPAEPHTTGRARSDRVDLGVAGDVDGAPRLRPQGRTGRRRHSRSPAARRQRQSQRDRPI